MSEISKEVWEDIGVVRNIDYKGYYQVSNQGSVRGLDRYVNAVYGKKLIKGIALSQSNIKGYRSVILTKNGECKTFLVHRLVLTAFVPNPENKPTGNHIDGVKTNNYVSNLEWATDLENIRHGWKLGLNNSKHIEKSVDMFKNGEYISTFRSMTIAGKIMNIFRENISACCRGIVTTAGGYNWEYEILIDKQNFVISKLSFENGLLQSKLNAIKEVVNSDTPMSYRLAKINKILGDEKNE